MSEDQQSDMQVVDIINTDFSAQEQDVTQEPQQPSIPEKFQGKSMEEVVEMYKNLESTVGRQSNELGELRKIRDQWAQAAVLQNAQSSEPAPEPESQEPIDWYEQPEKAVETIINKRLAGIEQYIQQQSVEGVRQRLSSAHPDYEKVVASTEFADWVLADPMRQQIYQQADSGTNFDAANYLLSEFKANTKQTQETNQTTDAVNSVIGETGSAPQPGRTRQVYRRVDVQNLRATDPQRYEQLLPEIKQAYKEGRVI